MHMSTRNLVGLLLLLIVSFVAWAMLRPASHPDSSMLAADAPLPQPPATPSDYVAAQNPHGFQLLVSYTNRGFEPKSAAIKAGETVRFTNNSSSDIWVAAGGEKLYPGGVSDCGSSPLDSCETIPPGRYWEFTFSQQGTWIIVNNLDKSKSVSIRVQ